MTSFTAAAWVGVSAPVTSPTAPLPMRLQPIPPDDPPDAPPEGAGTTAGAGAAAGAGVGGGGGVGVEGAVVVGVVDPNPELAVPPLEGTVTGAVGAGTGAGVLLGGTSGGMGTGNERTGMEGSDDDPLLGSETSTALTALGVATADDDDTTASVDRAGATDGPALYEVGRAAAAELPLAQAELAGVGGVGGEAVAGGRVPGWAGGEPAGVLGAGAAINPDQSEAEYVRFEMACFWATGDAEAARAVPSPTATTPTVTPWVTRDPRSRRAPTR